MDKTPCALILLPLFYARFQPFRPSVHRGAVCLVFHLPVFCHHQRSHLTGLFGFEFGLEFGLMPRLLYCLPIPLTLSPNK